MADRAIEDKPQAPKGNGGGQPKKTNRGRKIPRASVPLDDSPITAEMVAEACRRARVAAPAEAELRRLASIFSGYKGVFLAAQRDREANALSEEAGAAIATLLAVLPDLGSRCEALARSGDPFAGRQVRALADIFRAVSRSSERAAWQSNAPAVVRDWRWFAAVIMPVLAPAFPGVRGAAKGGPIARFLAQIVPLVAGDAPTAVAIATAIAGVRRVA